MAIKKSELYSSLWKSCDELRGGMDASQYKDYVLVLLFIKYVSDKYAGQSRPLIEIPKGSSFADMAALKGDKEIGDKINKQIISKIAEANNLKGVIDVADFNDADKLGKGKEMQDRLSNLVSIFNNPALDFRRNRAEGDDLLGDAYEYLMRHFATESGKSKGQFYTPAEVSRVMAKVIGINKAQNQSQTIYDPTCGSGSLLLKTADESNGITIYGQEMDNATYALARMNMILHGHPTADIWHDNSLSHPYFKQDGRNKPEDHNLKTFDFVVANPPFSNKAWSTGFDPYHDLYQRFADGVPPRKNGDYAFLLHIIRSLKSTGKGAVILPHGVLFRGNAEADIRRNIIRKGYIKGIIGLPPNLFYGTGIPACIIVLDKENAASRTGIFIIDASKGFMKDGNKNRLRYQDIHKIVDVFNKQIELPKYSRMVSVAEIEEKDYNLNIPRYIDSTEAEDIHDIEAHLLSGIPNRDIEALDVYWQVFPTLKQQLFEAGSRAGYSQLSVDIAQIKPTIFTHPEFVIYIQAVTALFEQWQTSNTPCFKSLDVGSHPKQLIETLSEDLLRVFAEAKLIDKYDVYQYLMSYWTNTMQDDVYMIALDGWKGNSDLIPPQLIINRYFAAEQQNIEKLEAATEAIVRKMEEMGEEHGGEGGLLEEAENEKGKITKASVKARLKDIIDDPDVEDERTILNAYLDLLEQETAANKRVRDAQKTLNSKVTDKYKVLSEEEVKILVVDDKWLTTLASDVQTKLNRISQALTGRIKQLAERYATPLPRLFEEVEVLSGKVEAHLKEDGVRMAITAQDTKFKPGYKQTEAVVIPEDWEVKSLGEIANISSGGTPDRLNLTYWGGDVPWMTTTQINFNLIDKANEFITKKGLENSAARVYNPGTLLMAMYGQGKTRGKVAVLAMSAAINQACAAIKVNKGISNKYVFFNLSARYDEIRSLSNTGNQENLNATIIKSILLPLPKEEKEQLAIVTALSDVDSLITSMDKLIAKKRDIKQATMQQLLTGKMRLPGFSGEWEEKTFGEVMTGFTSGATPSRKRPDFFKGNIRWITSGELNYNVIMDTIEKISTEAVSNTNLKLLPKGTFLMAITGLEAEGTRGSCGIVGAEATTNQSCMALFPTKELSTHYLFHYYVYKGKSLAVQYCQGTKQQSYTGKIVKLLPILLPPLPEQEAIANVLSDTDAEIAALEQKRDKTRALKQGMMQELLTGKTRLG